MTAKDQEVKKTVAIVGTRGYPSYYGGFETAVRRLAPFLVREGWDVIVYGRHGATKDDDPSREPLVKRRVTPGIESKSLSTLSYGLTACLDVVRSKPDVVIVMNVANGFWLPLLKARGIPTLVNVDGIEWDRAKWGRFAKLMFRAGAKMTAWFGDRLVFDARAIARRWDREFSRGGEFIPYGGDIPALLPIEEGLSHRGYILVVARFVPENTVPEFLAAARTLAESWPIVIVGSGGYGGQLDDQARALAASSANVHWLGHVSDDVRLMSLWQHAGVYFHGHSVGGTNPALVQAMACGAPTVARDTEYNREVLGEDGGLFAEPTPASITREIDLLMRNSLRQEHLSGLVVKRASAEYQWSGICARYNESLMKLIDRAER
ncbi:glycosyltransferase [Cryobacterium sp. PAMC25264]|uniref:glycosyltransferase n=1 Tax=Cryobacterium sp. PAMC25264 TaxID=2861288 RepID=UPI001C632D6F|nr:glycosyltransferase [Cryobacterium sp. PAMC25264]QYF73732.1 glycosyltransferase [Cryobacterium sp. PAMC25264]